MDPDYLALAVNQYQAIPNRHLFHHLASQVVNDPFQGPCLPCPLASIVHHIDSSIGLYLGVAFCPHEVFAVLTFRSIAQTH